MDPQVIIITGSKADLAHSQEIAQALGRLGIPHELRIASAHKSPQYLLDMVEQYDASSRRLVYIAVAGRSNALGGMLDGSTVNPVINCPPPSDRFAGMDILSSLRMPSGVAAATVLEAEAAALLAGKILALDDAPLRQRIETYQRASRERIEEDDAQVRRG